MDGTRRQSINQRRGTHHQIRDRIDLTLECIRRHYEGHDSPLSLTLDHHSDFFALLATAKEQRAGSGRVDRGEPAQGPLRNARWGGVQVARQALARVRSGLSAVWGTDFVAESNVVDRHIRSLRIKLQNGYRHPRFIATVPGKGYRFIPTFTNRGWDGELNPDAADEH